MLSRVSGLATNRPMAATPSPSHQPTQHAGPSSLSVRKPLDSGSMPGPHLQVTNICHPHVHQRRLMSQADASPAAPSPSASSASSGSGGERRPSVLNRYNPRIHQRKLMSQTDAATSPSPSPSPSLPPSANNELSLLLQFVSDLKAAYSSPSPSATPSPSSLYPPPSSYSSSSASPCPAPSSLSSTLSEDALMLANMSWEEVERRLNGLDQLLQNNLIDASEYQQRRNQLNQAKETGKRVMTSLMASSERNESQEEVEKRLLGEASSSTSLFFTFVPERRGQDDVVRDETAALEELFPCFNPLSVLGEADRTKKSSLNFSSFSSSSSSSSTTSKSRNVRVFVSSTFRDMTEERELLIKHAFPQLRKHCQERGVFLTIVDLRWGITSDQSQAGDTLNICLKEVERCRPYFVCMLGERYGWAQADGKKDELLERTFERAMGQYPWLERYLDRSITELEIRHGVLNEMSDRNIEHARFYFRSSSPGDSSEAESHARKLLALKREILSSGLNVQNYERAAELAQHVVEDLRALIDADFPLRDIPSPLEQDRMAHEAFAASRGRVYIGRQHYFKELTAHVSSPTGNKPIVVVGESGSGKSALVCNWATQYKKAHPQQLVITHYIGSTSSSTDLARLLRRVMSEIKEHHELSHDLPKDLPTLIHDFTDWLGEAGRRGGLVLVLDALNQLEDKEDAHSLAWLPQVFPNGVRLVVSTLPGRCYDEIQRRGWKCMRVQALDEQERTNLVEEYMAMYGKTLTKDQTERIVKADQCRNPLFLRTLLEEIRIFGVFEQIDKQIDHYLTAQTPPQLFSLMFTRLEQELPSSHKNLLADVLSLIWTSRRGLSESELLEITSVPPSIWSPLHLALEESLVSRSGMLTFFHDYMRQAVEKRYQLDSRERQVYYRRRLMAYFDKTTQQEQDEEEGREAELIRKCEEVPYQASKCGLWQELAEFITDQTVFPILLTDALKLDLYRYWQECKSHGQDVESKLLSKLEHYHPSLPSSSSSLSQKQPEEAKAKQEQQKAERLGDAAKFLQDTAHYEAAERLYRKALHMVETLYSKNYNNINVDENQVAKRLDGLAYLLRMRGQYEEAAPLYKRAVEIRERVLDSDDPQLAQSLNSLAILYRHQGKYKHAEPLYLRALAIRKKALGDLHEDVAQSLNSLGCLNQDMGRHKEAERFLMEALSMRESLLGSHHPDVAMSLTNLAGLYLDQTAYSKARPLYERSLNISETLFGPVHPSVAQALNSLAALAQEEAKYKEAEQLYKRSLAIKEQILGDSHPELALTLNDFAVLYARQDKYDMAEGLYLRALDIRRRALGQHHPDYASSLSNMGCLYRDMGKYEEALPLLQQALNIQKEAFGEKHMDVGTSYTNIAGLYQYLGRFDEALPLYLQALAILKESLGAIHADVAITLNDLAVLYFRQGNFAESEKAYKESLSIYQQVMGERHPNVAQAAANLGDFYLNKGDAKAALQEFVRAANIYEEVFGREHAKTQAMRAAAENAKSMF
ncbi:DUF4062 domain-containing protein [Balamuthia mandrillaris]